MNGDMAEFVIDMLCMINSDLLQRKGEVRGEIMEWGI